MSNQSFVGTLTSGNISIRSTVAVDINSQRELDIFVTTLNAALFSVGQYSGRQLMRPAEAKVALQMVALAQSIGTMTENVDINKTVPKAPMANLPPISFEKQFEDEISRIKSVPPTVDGAAVRGTGHAAS